MHGRNTSKHKPHVTPEQAACNPPPPPLEAFLVQTAVFAIQLQLTPSIVIAILDR